MKTRSVAFRLPLAYYVVIENRAKRMGLTVPEYLRHKAKYDAKRPH